VMGDGRLGIGPNPQPPIPNPQSPIPNPQFNSKNKSQKITTACNENENLINIDNSNSNLLNNFEKDINLFKLNKSNEKKKNTLNKKLLICNDENINDINHS